MLNLLTNAFGFLLLKPHNVYITVSSHYIQAHLISSETSCLGYQNKFPLGELPLKSCRIGDISLFHQGSCTTTNEKIYVVIYHQNLIKGHLDYLDFPNIAFNFCFCRTLNQRYKITKTVVSKLIIKLSVEQYVIVSMFHIFKVIL